MVILVWLVIRQARANFYFTRSISWRGLLFHMKHKLEGVAGYKLALSKCLFHLKYKLEGLVVDKAGRSKVTGHEI